MKKRIAAEWEPAIGVMVGYPTSLPKALVQKLAKDTQLYLLCPEGAGAVDEAKAYIDSIGIPASGVQYLQVPKGDDSSWPRDWGPHPLFDEEGGYAMLGPSYVLSTPFCGPERDAELYCAPWGEDKVSLREFAGDTSDDGAAEAIARQLGLPFQKLPIAFTGGNVLSDGVNSILSTQVLLLENQFKGFTREEHYRKTAQFTGMSNYTVLSDYEDFSLNHVDCFLKVLDDHRLLVLRPPADHPLYQRYEDIVNHELSHAVNSYGKPWEILRLDTAETVNGDGLAAYVNSLILNQCVYVPLYGIPQDQTALQQWREAMPGYDVQGFPFQLKDEPEAYNPDELYHTCGWDPGDVLHCRTRAVWDPGMLHIHVDTLDKQVLPAERYTVRAGITAYSGKELLPEGLKLYYRKAGTGVWNTVPLTATPTHEVYEGVIPGGKSGETIEYYVCAADASGRCATMPPVAPGGVYSFTIV